MTFASFSVVTPNYNMASFLPETIESVLLNLQPGDEYLVIDGGSTDGSVEIIKQYERHLSCWISEPDNGYADALAKGFKHCTGEFLCWINSGDLLLKGALQAARHSLYQTGADLIFGDDIYIDEKSRIISRSNGHSRSLKYMMLYGGWTPLQDACFWRRSLYDRVGGIDPTLKYAADYDFFLRASWFGHCLYVPSVFSAFRRHEGQKSICSSRSYDSERRVCQQRMLAQLGVPGPKRVLAETYYSLLTRWRHHITRRFHRAKIQLETPAIELSVIGTCQDES